MKKITKAQVKAFTEKREKRVKIQYQQRQPIVTALAKHAFDPDMLQESPPGGDLFRRCLVCSRGKCVQCGEKHNQTYFAPQHYVGVLEKS